MQEINNHLAYSSIQYSIVDIVARGNVNRFKSHCYLFIFCDVKIYIVKVNHFFLVKLIKD